MLGNFAGLLIKMGSIIFLEGHIGRLNFCSFLMMEFADLEEVWYMKGYLLKVCTTRRYSLGL